MVSDNNDKGKGPKEDDPQDPELEEDVEIGRASGRERVF